MGAAKVASHKVLAVVGRRVRRGTQAVSVLKHGLVQLLDRLGEGQRGGDAVLVLVRVDLEGALALVDAARDAAVDDQEAQDVLDLVVLDAESIVFADKDAVFFMARMKK